MRERDIGAEDEDGMRGVEGGGGQGGEGADVSSKTGQNGSVRFCRKVSFDLFSKVEKDSVH